MIRRLLSVGVFEMTENSDLIVRPHPAGFFSNFNKVMSYFVLNKGGRVFVDWTLESPVPHSHTELPGMVMFGTHSSSGFRP